MVAGLRSYLAATGLDVAKVIEKGALVLSSDQGHLSDGRFEVELMLEMLTRAIDRAIEDGYHSLWASGDMLWEFGSERNFDKRLEYELALDRLFHQYRVFSGVCQYHRDILPPAAIRVGVHTHPALFINQTLSRMNPLLHCPARVAAPVSWRWVLGSHGRDIKLAPSASVTELQACRLTAVASTWFIVPNAR